MSQWGARWALAALLCAAGCADDPADTSDVAQDAQLVSDGATAGESDTSSETEIDTANLPQASFEVTLGTGRKTHMPLADGDTLHLELGHQGLQHVLVSIRLDGLPQARYDVDFLLLRDDGVAIAGPTQIRLPFVGMPDGSGAELFGYTLVVMEPDLGVGHDALLSVAVEGPEGDVAMDERSVHVEWAPEGWDPDA